MAVWISLVLILLLSSVRSYSASDELCDPGVGEWVMDPSLPFYTEKTCRFGKSYQRCQSNGRRDMDFQRYRWKPSVPCGYQNFNTRKFGNLLRKKKVMVAGDSISRLFYFSTLCMLNSSRPLKKGSIKSTRAKGVVLPTFELPGSGMQIGTVYSKYLAAMLKDENGEEDITRINLSGFDEKWSFFVNDVDVIVFQATGWWFNNRTLTFYKGDLQVETSVEDAYVYTLKRIIIFLKLNNFSGTVVLLSHSPWHNYLPKGVADRGTTCQTTNLLSIDQVSETYRHTKDGSILDLQRNALRGSMIDLIDVTSMSMRRPDGHVQNYGDSKTGGDDCLHWCAGGVPPAWVELFYNYLLGNVDLHKK